MSALLILQAVVQLKVVVIGVASATCPSPLPLRAAACWLSPPHLALEVAVNSAEDLASLLVLKRGLQQGGVSVSVDGQHAVVSAIHTNTCWHTAGLRHVWHVLLLLYVGKVSNYTTALSALSLFL